MDSVSDIKIDQMKEEKDLLLGYYNRKIKHIEKIRNQVDPRRRTDDELALSLDITLNQMKNRQQQIMDELIELLRIRRNGTI